MANKEREVANASLQALIALENIREEYTAMYKNLVALSELLEEEENVLFHTVFNWYPDDHNLEDLGDLLAGIMHESNLKNRMGA
jgi:hypothetical protein